MTATIPDLNDLARYRRRCAALVERLRDGDRSAVAEARQTLTDIEHADRLIDAAYRRANGVERTGLGHLFTLAGAGQLAAMLGDRRPPRRGVSHRSASLNGDPPHF